MRGGCSAANLKTRSTYPCDEDEQSEKAKEHDCDQHPVRPRRRHVGERNEQTREHGLGDDRPARERRVGARLQTLVDRQAREPGGGEQVAERGLHDDEHAADDGVDVEAGAVAHAGGHRHRASDLREKGADHRNEERAHEQGREQAHAANEHAVLVDIVRKRHQHGHAGKAEQRDAQDGNANEKRRLRRRVFVLVEGVCGACTWEKTWACGENETAAREQKAKGSVEKNTDECRMRIAYKCEHSR